MTTQKIYLEPYDAHRLARLCGKLDEHIKQIAQHLDVAIHNRGNLFQFSGDSEAVQTASRVISELYQLAGEGEDITPELVHLQLHGNRVTKPASIQDIPDSDLIIRTRRMPVRPRGENQVHYIGDMRRKEVNFGIGPAGTGKTWLAVACAVEALEKDLVQRILLVRPAVEAGEKLGFLPGDLAEKIDPYLRPLYDALYEMLGFEKVDRLMEKNIIEVAPLAYMRGRTLNHSFVILDEAQNTTMEQMKMFLTRMGFGSRMVITGDITQIDLPKHQKSGLIHSLEILQGLDEIGITRFQSVDVVRHTLVQRIVEAYDQYEEDDAR